MKVRFTPAARREFLEVLRYLKDQNPEAARKVREQVEKSLQRLEKFPDSGRRLPEHPELDYREVLVPPYRFFYKVVPKTVWIVAVWHSSQHPSPPS